MDSILVTGTTGFIGKKLVEWLVNKGEYEVYALERYVTGRYTQSDIRGYTTLYANLQDYEKVHKLIAMVQPKYVIHLGALSAVSFSYDNYVEVSNVNYVGTLNLAEACRQEVPDFKQFIFAGTSEEYGQAIDDTHDILDEDTPMKPNSPYSVAKFASEHYLKYMGMAYKFPYTVMHPFNTYGRLENRHFFIEKTMSQMIENRDVRLGDPDAVRDWLYVDDHVRGYLAALGNQKAIGETFNLCTGNACTTHTTAQLIADICGYAKDIRWNTIPKRPLDAKVLRGDNRKAQRLLDWQPQYSLREGLFKLHSDLVAQMARE